MPKPDFVLSGYMGINQILCVRELPRVGVTAIVQNADHARSYYGGNAVNVAYCLAKLGRKALPVMRGGSDFDGTGFRAFLEGGDVLCDALTLVPSDTTPICYLVEDDGKNHLTLFYPGSMRGKYAPDDLPDAYFKGVGMAVLAVGSYEDNTLFLRKVKQHGLPLAFGMRADFDAFPKELLHEILHEAKIIFTNQCEREMIEGLYEMDSITRLLECGKAQLIVTTLGAQGSVIYEKTASGVKEHRVPAVEGKQVVDATGAGDAYIAGFLHGYSKGEPPEVCAQYGGAVSSFVIEQVGCLTNVPTEEQMLARAAAQRADESRQSHSK